MTTNEPERDYITIVSGLPRSGTSMMMNAIHAGGIDPLIDQVRGADEDNPNGYFEFEPVKKTKEDAAWLNNAAGKVVKMVYRLLYDLPEHYRYRVVFMRRNITEVLQSQTKMLERSGKPGGGVSDAQMHVLFTTELNKSVQWLTQQPNFEVLYVNYSDMINDGPNQIQKINAFLGGNLDTDAMAEVVDPNLYRNRKT